jgi:hypothetical protein
LWCCSYYLAKAGKHVGIPLLVAVGAEVWDHTEAGGGFTDRAEDRCVLPAPTSRTQMLVRHTRLHRKAQQAATAASSHLQFKVLVMTNLFSK